MSSWEFRRWAIPCRSSGCSSKTTIRVFTGCFSWGDIYVRVRGRTCGLLFAIPAAQMSSREFCQVYSPQRTRRTQRSCCPQIPSAPIYTDFLQSGKEGIETALPTCLLSLFNLRRINPSPRPCAEDSARYSIWRAGKEAHSAIDIPNSAHNPVGQSINSHGTLNRLDRCAASALTPNTSVA